MFTAFRHTHVLVIIVFLLLFLIKSLLLFFNRRQGLETFRQQTRVLDIVFGVLILVTGAYLLISYSGPLPLWLRVKAVLVLVAIPLSIISLKRKNKFLTALSLVLFAYVYGVAESKNLAVRTTYDMDPEEAYQGTDTTALAAAPRLDSAAARKEQEQHSALPPAPAIDQIERKIVNALEAGVMGNAQAVYTQQCATCHGDDGGKLVAKGANLQRSDQSLQQRQFVITHGRGLMPAYAEKLTEQEVEALAAYTLTLTK